MTKTTPQTLDEFFSTYAVLRYPKGQTIIHADDIPSGVFFIKNGFIKMSTVLEDGRQYILNIFKPGSYFPLIWAITDTPNTYYFETISNVELQRAPRDVLLEFIKKNPSALFELTKRILISVKGLLVDTEQTLLGGSYQRVASTLLLVAKRFGTKEQKGKLALTLPLTHQEIADFIGTTRETVSLAMEKLTKKNVISYKNHTITVNNLELLKKESTVYEQGPTSPNTL